MSPADPASNLNLPNALTALRIVLVPFFVWFLWVGGTQGEDSLGMRWAALAVFAVAMYTDKLDGDIARARGLITSFGKIADPIADKLLTGGALVCLSILGELAWWVTAVILLRELGITLYRMAVLSDRVIPASRGGKLKTILQAVAIAFFLTPLWTVLGDWMHWVNGALMTAAVIATVLSGVDYLVKAIRHGRQAP